MTKNRDQINSERRRFWENHIEQWSSSGLTQAEYCRQHDISSNRFTYWKCKFKREKTSSGIVPVPVSALSSPGSGRPVSSCELRLCIDSRYDLFIQENVSSSLLEKVITAVEKISCCQMQI
ncbi:MAG TPA: IS66 family insertion sequence hypothetical protein [Gammaproteobacteria bacterium]|nr:IS66 family insertion sequence hypothetical protein [Gammaproteobacteria bacterium]